MGGSWERLIKSVKRISSALLTSQSISDEILLTIMTEIESIINSRPLVSVSFEPNSQEPLTNHLLLLRANLNVPPGLLDKNDCYARRRWAQAQYLTNQFWCGLNENICRTLFIDRSGSPKNVTFKKTIFF